MNIEEKINQIVLSLIPGVGPKTAKVLISYIGSIEGIFKESKKNLLKIPGFGKNTIAKIQNPALFDVAEKEIEFIQKNNIRASFYLDKDYPAILKEYEDCPIMLYSKGEQIIKDNSKIISIVGTRSATEYGRHNCEKLITDLKENGYKPIIVSGLAYGIDITAHKSALKNELKTIAVLGQGLHTIYPKLHASVAKQIEENGMLMTEYNSQSKVDRANFVTRNRIIAAISEATIIIESGSRGGSLITAEFANSYQKAVFAFPGKTTDKLSLGCNKLIKINKAHLIETYKDLEYILGWEKQNKNDAKQIVLPINLTEEEQKIYNLLKEKGKISIDLISVKTELMMNKVSSLLIALEFKGIVKSYPGKVFSL